MTINTGNTINSTSSTQTAAAVKPEATQAGQPKDTAKVQQNSSGKTGNSAQAVLVALESIITSELKELTQTVATRTALIKSLPPEVRELVQQLLSQNQAAQATLSEGLVALLKSPKTGTEKLVMLADIMEQAAGLPAKEGKGEPASQAATSKQQQLTELATAWQGKKPGDLQEAAKVLRELAAPVQPSENMTKQQESPANTARQSIPGNNQQDIRAAVPQPDGAVSQTPEKAGVVAQADMLKEQTELAPTNKSPNQAPETKQPEIPQQQGNLINKSQDLPTKPLKTASESAKSQELAQLLKAFTNQPELVESLPPEIRKMVLTLLQKEEPSMPTPQTTQMAQQTAQTEQAPQKPQTTQNQNTPTQQTPTPASQPITPTPNPQAGQAMQTLPQALAELLTSLNKSQQSPKEKIIMLASILEQVAEMLTTKDPQAAQPLALRQQAIVEMAKLLQEKSPEELKAAIKVVQELTETMSKPSGVTAERQEAQKVLTFAVPLYLGEGQTAYPAYIHVYYQEEEDKQNPGQKVTETWLRICLETENIGMVDAAFRLYDENNLDVKVRFTDAEAAAGFADSMEEVKEQLGQLPFTLGEFLVKEVI